MKKPSKLIAKYKEYQKKYLETEDIKWLAKATGVQIKIHKLIKERSE